MKIAIFIAGALIAGCTAMSSVSPLNDGMYTVTAENLSGTSVGGHETARALQRAQEFCQDRQKVALLKSHAQAGVPGFSVISGTVVFVCVDPTSDEYVKQPTDSANVR